MNDVLCLLLAHSCTFRAPVEHPFELPFHPSAAFEVHLAVLRMWHHNRRSSFAFPLRVALHVASSQVPPESYSIDAPETVSRTTIADSRSLGSVGARVLVSMWKALVIVP